MFKQQWFRKIAYDHQLREVLESFGEDEGKRKKYNGENEWRIEHKFEKSRKSVLEQGAKDILIACDLNIDGKLNFNEYLLIRKGVVAWLQCAQTSMNRAGLKCGLTLTVPGRQIEQSEADIMFRLGHSLMHKRNST